MAIAFVPNPSGGGTLQIVQQSTIESGGFASLDVYNCDVSAATVCQLSYSLSFPQTNFFQPSLVPIPGGSTALTYWTDAGLWNGTIQLQLGLFDLQGNGPTYAASQAQVPCSYGTNPNDIWGDYDTSWVRTTPGSYPTVVRPVTDSTYQSCDARTYRAFSQHISLVELAAY